MAIYVLVHGAWHGGWCWRDVRARLEGAGHVVYTPTLTGLGERSHLLSPAVNLDTHITDIVNVIEWEELSDVILVGHSFGGHVITGVADRLKHRIRHIIYLDAFCPADGESPAAHVTRLLCPGSSQADIDAAIATRSAASTIGGGSPAARPEAYDVPPESGPLYDWVARRVTAHPVGAQIQPIRLANSGSDGLPRTYILCTGGAGPTPFMALVDRSIRPDDSWILREIATGHDAMITAPEDTARLLLEPITP